MVKRWIFRKVLLIYLDKPQNHQLCRSRANERFSRCDGRQQVELIDKDSIFRVAVPKRKYSIADEAGVMCMCAGMLYVRLAEHILINSISIHVTAPQPLYIIQASLLSENLLLLLPPLPSHTPPPTYQLLSKYSNEKKNFQKRLKN